MEPQSMTAPTENPWDDTTDVRQRRRVVLDHQALALLERIACANFVEDARDAAAALESVLGDQRAGSARLIAALVDRCDELERLRNQARRDELTGIANRRAFNEAFDRALSAARRAERPVSIVLIDLDGLKAINDSLGHPAGDQALQRTARLIEELVRSGDLVARIGGDEFGVLLPDTDSEEAGVIGERLRRELSAVGIEVSLGVSVCDRRRYAPGELLAEADSQLYRDKVIRKSQRPPTAEARP